MASTRTTLGTENETLHPKNTAPAGFNSSRDLPKGFIEFLLPLHRALSAHQRQLIERRSSALAAAHRGQLPNYRPASAATTEAWRIDLPEWCRDQRNQMTGPADDAELV